MYQNNIISLLEIFSKRQNVNINYRSLTLGQLAVPKRFIGIPESYIQNR